MPNFPSRLEFRWVIASWMERVMGSLSPSYEGKDQRYFSGVRKDLIDRLGVDANRAILEIGCGDGSTGAYAKQQGKCGLYVGVELFPDAANVAKAGLRLSACAAFFAGRAGNGEFGQRGSPFDRPHASHGRMDARQYRTHG